MVEKELSDSLVQKQPLTSDRICQGKDVMLDEKSGTSKTTRPALTGAGLLSRASSYFAAAQRKARELSLKPIYAWYTHRLMEQVKAYPAPQHVALILDGNRRFARMYPSANGAHGYRAGAQKVTEVVRWCDALEIPVVTLWALSTDNLNRAQDELNAIFHFVGERLQAFAKGQTPFPFRRRIKVVGRLDILPEPLRHSIQEAERLSASSGPWLLNVAVAYGGRDEILDALKQLLRARASKGDDPLEIAQDLSLDDIRKYLYAPDVPEPDLVIRTSGEVRLSGFLLWQSAYSELYFCDTLWPAFRKLDLLRAIRSFQGRQRRFGS